MPAEKKYSLWKEKLEIVLDMNWNEVMKSKISSLYLQLNTETYNRTSSSPPNQETVDFINAWETDLLGNNLIDSLNFTVHFCTLMTWTEIDQLVYHHEEIDLSWLEGYETLLNDGSVPGGGGSVPAGGDCKCRYDLYCGIFGGECKSGNCASNYNCGVTGTSECKGKCQDDDL